ncbi:MAG TPA: hypothetical protein VGM90_26300 [Kofleriaceae bacterium]|jgi:hypothetical protein
MGESDGAGRTDRGYRLAPVRDVRAREQRVREGNLAAAVGDARTTQAVVDAAASRAQAARDAIDAARSRLASDGTTAQRVALAERHLARLRRDRDAALDALARAEAAHTGQLAVVDSERQRLVRARADKELIERHFARWRAEKAKLAERRED